MSLVPLLAGPFLLLAQAQSAPPVIIAQDTAISWPVLVTILAVAAVVIESRVKINRLEKDLDHVQNQSNTTALQLAGTAGTLGEIKEGIKQMRDELRQQGRARDSAA